MGYIKQLEEENIALKYLIAKIMHEVSDENIECIRLTEPDFSCACVIGRVQGLLSMYDSGREVGR